MVYFLKFSDAIGPFYALKPCVLHKKPMHFSRDCASKLPKAGVCIGNFARRTDFLQNRADFISVHVYENARILLLVEIHGKYISVSEIL